ncbi:hypothetical protein D3C72_1892170 [compost metagenome]
MTERFQRAGKGGHLLAVMHARLIAHLPALPWQPRRQPGLVRRLGQPVGIPLIQIDEVDVVERGRHRFLVQVIPDQVAHEAGAQRPVGQRQLPRRPQADHAHGIGAQQIFSACLEVPLFSHGRGGCGRGVHQLFPPWRRNQTST